MQILQYDFIHTSCVWASNVCERKFFVELCNDTQLDSPFASYTLLVLSHQYRQLS